MSGNGEKVIALDKERMQAMTEKDVAKLKNLICKDLVYTHSSARLDTKESLIGNMESGATVYTRCTPSDVEALDLGDVACHRRADITVEANGNPNAFSVRFTDVWQSERPVPLLGSPQSFLITHFPNGGYKMNDTYTPPKVWKWEGQDGGAFTNINRPVAGATHEKVLPVGEHPLQLYSLGTPNGVKVTSCWKSCLPSGTVVRSTTLGSSRSAMAISSGAALLGSIRIPRSRH